jgi:hypothetical protein
MSRVWIKELDDGRTEYVAHQIDVGEFVSLVDTDDADRVAEYKWHPQRTAEGRLYAKANAKPRVNGTQTTLFLHRFILGFPDGEVDHINGDGLDNRKANLRVASRAQNAANRPAQRGRRLKGVYPNRSGTRWRAQAKVNYRAHYLGTFDTEEEAALAYDEFAAETWGEFAHLNNGGPNV